MTAQAGSAGYNSPMGPGVYMSPGLFAPNELDAMQAQFSGTLQQEGLLAPASANAMPSFGPGFGEPPSSGGHGVLNTVGTVTPLVGMGAIALANPRYSTGLVNDKIVSSPKNLAAKFQTWGSKGGPGRLKFAQNLQKASKGITGFFGKIGSKFSGFLGKLFGHLTKALPFLGKALPFLGKVAGFLGPVGIGISVVSGVVGLLSMIF